MKVLPSVIGDLDPALSFAIAKKSHGSFTLADCRCYFHMCWVRRRQITSFTFSFGAFVTVSKTSHMVLSACLLAFLTNILELQSSSVRMLILTQIKHSSDTFKNHILKIIQIFLTVETP